MTNADYKSLEPKVMFISWHRETGKKQQTSEVCRCKKKKKKKGDDSSDKNPGPQRAQERKESLQRFHRETRTYMRRLGTTLYHSLSKQGACVLQCSMCDNQLCTFQALTLANQRQPVPIFKKTQIRRWPQASLPAQLWIWWERENCKVQLYCFLLILLSLITVNKIELGKLLLAGE